MAVVWSREFLVALLCFLSPLAMAAILVYHRVLNSNLVRKRRRVRVNGAAVRQAFEQTATQPAAVAVPPTPAPSQSLQQSLENLRQCLVEFRGSIQHSRSALADLRECDCRFSHDLGRASEVMQHAFTK